MAQPDWLRGLNRAIHLTIRDVDCEGFDVEAMMREFDRLNVTVFSFFAGGYVTTYPTDLELQRKSPWLGSRDLTGEIVEAAHRYGIKAIPMIDLGQLPKHAYEAHPEWAAVPPDGGVGTEGPDLYTSCPMGGFIRDYCRQMVREIVGRYDVDGMKFGGGSYGFTPYPCHCDACRKAYAQDVGCALPLARNWDDRNWRRYVRWRTERTAETVQLLVDMVHQIKPELPVVGNAVCFGDPGWTVKRSLDMDRLANIEDIVQVEIQSRAWYDHRSGTASWKYLRWPAETAAYMSEVTDHPVWAVTSYFYAWPWRRNCAPPIEQKVYLAQVAAHGGSPMVNLAGGPPAVHEDKRGFRAIKELYGFLAEHESLIAGDRSGAEVAIVYDPDTLMFYGNDDAEARVVQEIRGFEEALHARHVPFDIISTRTLEPGRLSRYETLILPNLACLPQSAAQRLRDYVQDGGGLLASFETGLVDADMARRDDYLLGDLIGVSYRGQTSLTVGEYSRPRQVYMKKMADHPLLENLAEPEILLIGGWFCRADVRDGATTLLARTAPFRLFPEGWAYPDPDVPDPEDPLVVCNEIEGGGRTVYFAPAMGKFYWQARYPDHAALICDAVAWAGAAEPPLKVNGPRTLHTSLRWKDRSAVVHCINLTGGERFFTELVPLRDIELAVRMPGGADGARAYRASDGAELPVHADGDYAVATLPDLKDYDLLVVERA